MLLNEILSCFPFEIYLQLMHGFGLTYSDYNGTIIDIVNPSTITVGGKFTNVTLNEKLDINKFYTTDSIVKIGSNFGEHISPTYVEPVKPLKTSKRGRKKKEKKPKTRIQGSGKYFNSQITFIVKSPTINTKFYKFKIFRTGVFQVPGILNAEMKDIYQPISILKDYFKTIYNVDVTNDEPQVQMRNCKSILLNKNLTINTKQIGEIIDKRKIDNDPIKIDTVEYLGSNNTNKIIIKFNRPTAAKFNKKTTLKILKQKINIEGAISIDDIKNICEWLNRLMIDNYPKVINDPSLIDNSDSSDTDDE